MGIINMKLQEFFQLIEKWIKKNKTDRGITRFMIASNPKEALFKNNITPTWVLMDGNSYQKLVRDASRIRRSES